LSEKFDGASRCPIDDGDGKKESFVFVMLKYSFIKSLRLWEWRQGVSFFSYDGSHLKREAATVYLFYFSTAVALEISLAIFYLSFQRYFSVYIAIL
jgi:hypothetical protein